MTNPSIYPARWQQDRHETYYREYRRRETLGEKTSIAKESEANVIPEFSQENIRDLIFTLMAVTLADSRNIPQQSKIETF
jgi:hypothetical protein